MRTNWIIAATGALALGLAGCDDCEKTTRAIGDLGKARTLLAEGLQAPEAWKTTCSSLVQWSDVFRSDADDVREVADDRYRGIPQGCALVGYADYCSGGWRRWPYVYGAADFDGIQDLDGDGLIADGHRRGGDGRGRGGARPAPSRPDPRPHPGPRPGPQPDPRPRPPHHPPRPVPHPHPHPRPRPPVVVYPPHYPTHPRWHWRSESRVCHTVPVCLRWEQGRPQKPGYEQVLAIAYELDQAAGGIESACRKAYEGAPAAEVDTIARDTLTRIESHALPGLQSLYTALGCSRQGS